MFARYVCNYPGKISKESDQTNPQTEHCNVKLNIRKLWLANMSEIKCGQGNDLTVLFVISAIVDHFSTAHEELGST